MSFLLTCGQCTLEVYKCLYELYLDIDTMPEHQEKFHEIISYLLETYISACQKKIQQALKDTETGRLVSFKEYVLREKSEISAQHKKL